MAKNSNTTIRRSFICPKIFHIFIMSSYQLSYLFLFLMHLSRERLWILKFSQLIVLQQGLDNAQEIRLGSSFQRATEKHLQDRYPSTVNSITFSLVVRAAREIAYFSNHPLQQLSHAWSPAKGAQQQQIHEPSFMDFSLIYIFWSHLQKL